MKDSQPIRIPCTGSAEIPVEQRLTYPVDARILFDGQEVLIDCTLAVDGRCTAATSGTHPCTTADSLQRTLAQFLSY